MWMRGINYHWRGGGSSGGAPALTSLPIGKCYFVDSTTGVDATGLRNRLDKQFACADNGAALGAAITLAGGSASGDTVFWFPGTYDVNNTNAIFRNGINHHFFPGAIIQQVANTGNLITDGGTAMTFKIDGFGNFNTLNGTVINISHSSSNIEIRCLNMKADGAICVRKLNGNLILNVEKFVSNSNTTADVVSIAGDRITTINCDQILPLVTNDTTRNNTSSRCVNIDNSGGSQINIRANRIYERSSGQAVHITNVATGAAGQDEFQGGTYVNINANFIENWWGDTKATNTACILIENPNIVSNRYIYITGNLRPGGTDAGDLTTRTADGIRLTGVGVVGSRVDLHGDIITQEGQAIVMDMLNGIFNHVGKINRPSNGGGAWGTACVQLEEGTLSLETDIYSLSDDIGILKEGGVLVLKRCSIITATAESIDSSAPQDVIVHWAVANFLNPVGNITTIGNSVIVDVNFQ